MKILFTMYGWREEGGGTIRPRNLARALVRRGYSVSVIYTPSQPRDGLPPYFVEESMEEGVWLFGVYNRPAPFIDPAHPEREIHDPKMCEVVRGLVDRIRPDLIHIHSLLGFSLETVRLFSEMGVPVLYTSRNYWPLCPTLYLLKRDLSPCFGPSEDGRCCALCLNSPGKAPLYARRLEAARRHLGHYIHRHLAISSRAADIFSMNGFPTEKVRVLHQQPETADLIWRKVGSSRVPGRARLPLRVGYLGYVLPMKGVHILVEALQHFDRHLVEGRIYGRAVEDYADALMRLDRKGLLKLQGAYSLDVLPGILSGIDLLVVPSLWEETQGVVVAEGLAGGVPVIGSRIGGIPEFIEDGVNGFLFEPGDPCSLAERIEAFLKDPHSLAEMARRIAPPRGFEAYMDDLLRHYEEVVEIARSKGRAFRVPQRRTLSICWEGPFSGSASLALINRELCRRLAKAGHELRIVPRERALEGLSGTEWLGELSTYVHKPLSREPDVVVRHMWPMDLAPPESGRWVVIQPWELGNIPTEWIQPLSDQVDEIWTPSQHSKAAFQRAGVPPEKIAVIPNGVDTGLFKPEGPRMSLSTRKGFKFLFVGGTIRRKGIDVLLMAYARAFTRNDDVCLVIKDQGVGTLYPGQNEVELVRRYQLQPLAPEIVYMDEEIGPGEMASLYRACDCLVHPFRAEGFGLPIAEAMACGIPIVASRWVPVLEFCDERFGYFVRGKKVAGAQDSYAGMRLAGPVVFFEPDVEDLARVLRHVYENPEEAAGRGEAAPGYVMAHLSWEAMYERVLERIRIVRDRPARRRSGRKIMKKGVMMNSMAQISDLEERIREGEARYREGRIQEAEAAFRGVIECSPGHPKAISDLAALLWETGRAEEALKELTRAVEAAPEDRDVVWNLGQILMALGQEAVARRLFASYSERHPEAEEFAGALRQWDDASDTPVPVGSETEALQTLTDPIRLQRACRHGEELAELGFMGEAREVFISILEEEPAHAPAHNNLAFIQWHQGDVAGAVREVTRAMELDPTDPDILWNCGQILAGLGRTEEAEALLNGRTE